MQFGAEVVDEGVVGVARNSTPCPRRYSNFAEIKNAAIASNAHGESRYHLGAEVVNASAVGVACGSTLPPARLEFCKNNKLCCRRQRPR